MCYAIRCGGSLVGATIIALSAPETLKQVDDLQRIGVVPTAIVKNDRRVITLFELKLLASDRPIRADVI